MNIINIQELEKSVNEIFECDSKLRIMQAELARINAEKVLLDHLMQAMKLTQLF